MSAGVTTASWLRHVRWTCEREPTHLEIGSSVPLDEITPAMHLVRQCAEGMLLSSAGFTAFCESLNYNDDDAELIEQGGGDIPDSVKQKIRSRLESYCRTESNKVTVHILEYTDKEDETTDAFHLDLLFMEEEVINDVPVGNVFLKKTVNSLHSHLIRRKR